MNRRRSINNLGTAPPSKGKEGYILTKAKRQVGQSQDYKKGDGYSRVSIYTRVTAPPSKGKEEYTALY